MKNIFKFLFISLFSFLITTVQVSAASCKLNCITSSVDKLNNSNMKNHECCDKNNSKKTKKIEKCEELGAACNIKMTHTLDVKKYEIDNILLYNPTFTDIINKSVVYLNPTTYLDKFEIIPKYSIFLFQQKFLI
jgi:hypothetical protein